MTGTRWQFGDQVVRREFLHGHPWIGFATYVVQDTPDLLAVYLAPGSALAFPDWPFDRWVHPWQTAGHRVWQGHGKLMLQRPGEPYSVDLYWSGPDRTFSGWYFNLQDPFRRYDGGFDTLDHELDYWLPAEGDWVIKDAELFEERVREGRYSAAQAEAIRDTGRAIAELLTSRAYWWDSSWQDWSAPADWQAIAPPPGWDSAEAGVRSS